MSGNVLWPYTALGHLLNTLQYELGQGFDHLQLMNRVHQHGHPGFTGVGANVFVEGGLDAGHEFEGMAQGVEGGMRS